MCNSALFVFYDCLRDAMKPILRPPNVISLLLQYYGRGRDASLLTVSLSFLSVSGHQLCTALWTSQSTRRKQQKIPAPGFLSATVIRFTDHQFKRKGCAWVSVQDNGI